MQFSVALLSALATSASALPLLNVVTDLLKTPTLPLAENTVHVVWTSVKADHLVSLSVLDGAAKTVLAHTCGDKLVTGVFETVPIDFSQLSPDGLGQFVFNDATYQVKDVLSGAVAEVSCVHQSLKDGAVLDCVLPVVGKLKDVTEPLVSGVEDTLTCLTSDIPLISDLPALQALGL